VNEDSLIVPVLFVNEAPGLRGCDQFPQILSSALLSTTVDSLKEPDCYKILNN
jgi:hypothetical protein